MNEKPVYLQTKIFLDSGDPAETREVLTSLGFLDGQTTNPSLVAKNPTILELKAKGELNELDISKLHMKLKKLFQQVQFLSRYMQISIPITRQCLQRLMNLQDGSQVSM
jgi:transaldolase